MANTNETRYGIDMNLDGKIDLNDDTLIAKMIEQENRKKHTDKVYDMD